LVIVSEARHTMLLRILLALLPTLCSTVSIGAHLLPRRATLHRGRGACVRALEDDDIRQLFVLDEDDDEYDDDDEDIPEAQLDTGMGPFATTLGSWDDENAEPDFLQKNDWHISSTYTAAEREEIDRQEQEQLDQILDVAAEDTTVFAESNYKYIKYDEGEVDLDASSTAKTKMPTSWQEYQFLQREVANFANGEGAAGLTQKQLETAAALEQQLQDFYPVFKNILDEGWRLDFNPVVDEAGVFVSKLRKANKA